MTADLKADRPEAQIAADLVERIISGDASAETQMVHRYQKGLITMLRVRSRDTAVADDITNETWSLVLVKIRGNELRDSSKLAAFILQIGRNLLLMHYRKNQKHKYESEDAIVNTATSDPSPEQQLENKQLGVTLGRVLGELKQERDRQILRRFYVDQEEKDVLCDELGLSHQHFDRVLFRARERFRALIAK